ncbi:MAG: hypothetical protein EOO06_13200 [Chitinophagaceae bacterium]|nr:MAG: hypothetical protein EOO06_13200 [Chitinophagaceae bacterium]
MKVELISYTSDLDSALKLKLTKQLFNQSEADIILFPGHTIDTVKDLKHLSNSLENNHRTVAFLELKEIGARGMTNWSFKIENNALINCNSNQQFVTSKDIEGNEQLAANLLHAINTSRLHKVKGKRVCYLICGEMNILTNIQGQDNKVVIRSDIYKKEFDEIFRSADIILNPLHTPMGNQGKMHKRRVYFSKKQGAYFSTANLEYKKQYAEEYFKRSKSLQYAYYNGKPLKPEAEMICS